MARDERKDHLDNLMNRLAKQLRDKGTAPARDLWSDIDRTISASEEKQLRPLPRRRWDWWQIAATAAAVFVLGAVGWWGQGYEMRSDKAPGPLAQQESPATAGSELDMINLALAELNSAMAEDPENRSLAGLALMLHQSRGRVMRQNTELQF